VVLGSSEAVVRLPHDVDLHARPAAQFVRTAMGFGATVQVFANDRMADAKSLLAVLSLGARRGAELRLTADGPDADVALDALAACVAGLAE
jgi:phosphotransferase system HPr (HPr) family protein